MGDFLKEGRGFCQHYAATMAMMARTLDIPSRVVVGFLQSSDVDDGEFIMSSNNVHAWPELYFEGVGWVRFEPTPGVQADYPTWAPRTSQPTSTLSVAEETAPGETETTRPTRAESSADDSEAAGGSGGSSGPLPPVGLLITLVVIAVLLIPAALRTAVRRSRLNRPMDPAAAAESSWLELRDRMRDLRLPWGGSMTPRAREHPIALHLYDDPDAKQALHRLVINVERSRYARSLAAEADPTNDVVEVMSVLSREAGRGPRLRAFLLPSSLLPDIRTGWSMLKARLRPQRSPAT